MEIQLNNTYDNTGYGTFSWFISWKTSWGYHKSDGLYPWVSSMQSREIVAVLKAEQNGSPHAVLGQGSVRRTGLAPWGCNGGHPDHDHEQKDQKAEKAVPQNTLNKQKVMKLQFAVILIADQQSCASKTESCRRPQVTLFFAWLHVPSCQRGLCAFRTFDFDFLFHAVSAQLFDLLHGLLWPQTHSDLITKYPSKINAIELHASKHLVY